MPFRTGRCLSNWVHFGKLLAVAVVVRAGSNCICMDMLIYTGSVWIW